MKRTIVMIFAAMLLTLTACTGGSKPDNTAAPTQVVSNETAVPGATENPYPTQDPAKAAYDPVTDLDNRTAGLRTICFAESEDAYYMYTKPLMRYWDKYSEDGDVLCPNPECEHPLWDKSCKGYADATSRGLAFYKGKLYWLEYGLDGLNVYCENPDGYDRQKALLIALDERYSGDTSAYFHRGYVYLLINCWNIIGGVPCAHLTVGRVPLEGGDYEEIVCVPSTSFPSGTIRFVGDDAYIYASYDGIDGTGIQSEEELERLQQENPLKMVVMRWNEYMAEPQVLYELEGEAAFPYSFFVDRDGTPYFAVSTRKDNDSDEVDVVNNPAIGSLYRVEKDGTATKLFSMVDDQGAAYTIRAVLDGCVVGIPYASIMSSQIEEYDIWVRGFDGETIFKGALPLKYREDLEKNVKHCIYDYSEFWGDKDVLFAAVEEDYPNSIKQLVRTFVLKLEFADGAVTETVIAENARTNAD